MATATIPRMKFLDVEDSLASERVQLAKDAADKLGYSKLARAIAVPGALLFALRKLGIEPLIESSVLVYQAKKAKPGMWSGHKKGVAWWLAACIFLASARYFYHPGLMDESSPLSFFEVVISGMAVIVCVIRGCYMLFAEDARGERTTRHWKGFPIASYAGNIPEYALSKALQIKRETPKVELYIERLYEETERIEPTPSPDPFLVAKLGNELYYIEVWDEKEYEAKL